MFINVTKIIADINLDNLNYQSTFFAQQLYCGYVNRKTKTKFYEISMYTFKSCIIFDITEGSYIFE